MAKIQQQIRYFIQRGNSFYWQPSSKLRLQGWVPQKLNGIRDVAIQEAKALNQKLDEWYLSDGENNQNSEEMRVYTLKCLIDDFKKSIEFRRTDNGTQVFYSNYLNKIEAWGGEYPAKAITRRSIKVLYTRLYDKAPETANGLMRTLRRLMYWGVDEEKLTVNPAARIGIIDTPPRDRVAEEQEISLMRSQADKLGLPSIGTAILMGFFLGQRESDLLKLDWQQHYVEHGDYAAIRVKQNKTRQWVEVPLALELKERLTKISDRRGKILKREDGKPYTRSCFCKRYEKIRKSLIENYPELKTLQFRDLRRTVAVRLAEAGCSEIEISAVTGHRIETSRQILEVYVPRTGKMAAAAIRKLTEAA